MENSLLDGLNNEQLNSVTDNKGILTVLAGAGSGKTRVLTTRIAYMVENGISPYRILAVTFTNKAAKEMKSRLEKILGEEVVKNIWVGTFHSICGRILRQDIENYKNEEGIKCHAKRESITIFSLIFVFPMLKIWSSISLSIFVTSLLCSWKDKIS